jgi:hypothetical protein
MGKKSRISAARELTSHDDTPSPGGEATPLVHATASRLLVCLIGVVAAGVFAVSVWFSIGQNLELPWTSIRLAPAFALSQGYPLYSAPDQPPWVMVGYGPLYPMAYLPVVWARHPVPAVTAATLLAHLYILAPAALLFSLLGRRGVDEPQPQGFHWVFSFLLFALLTHLAPSLLYITAGVHADAPALGLFLLACYVCLRSGEVPGATETRWLLAAGALAGLAAACKINLLAGVAALFLWSFRVAGAKRSLVFLGCSAVALALVYAGAALQSGASAVWLNLLQPGKMPWFTFHELSFLSLSGSSHEMADKVRTFLTFSRSYAQDYGPIALAVLVVLGWSKRNDAMPQRRLIGFFLFLSLILLPASIVSIAKYGGDVNSRALVSLPLALAAVFALAFAARSGQRGAYVATLAAVAGAAFMLMLSAKDAMQRRATRTMPTLVEAYSVLRADPARWYFPYDPLAHLMVEGKFRPNADVIYSYATSDFPVEENAFRSALSDDLTYIAVPPSLAGWGLAEIQRLLPEYSRPSRDLVFERHQVYSR